MLHAVMKIVGPPVDIKRKHRHKHVPRQRHTSQLILHSTTRVMLCYLSTADSQCGSHSGTAGAERDIKETHPHPSQSGCKPRSISSLRRKRRPIMREDKDPPPAARRNWPLYSTGKTQSRPCSQPGNAGDTRDIESQRVTNNTEI